MNSEIRKTLEAVKSGELSVDDALLAIKKEPFEDIGYAKVDLHRGFVRERPRSFTEPERHRSRWWGSLAQCWSMR